MKKNLEGITFCGLGLIIGLVASGSLLIHFSQKVNQEALHYATERIQAALLLISVTAVAVTLIAYQLGKFQGSLLCLLFFILGTMIGSYLFGSVSESAQFFHYDYTGVSVQMSEPARLAVNTAIYASVGFFFLLWRRFAGRV